MTDMEDSHTDPEMTTRDHRREEEDEEMEKKWVELLKWLLGDMQC